MKRNWSFFGVFCLVFALAAILVYFQFKSKSEFSLRGNPCVVRISPCDTSTPPFRCGTEVTFGLIYWIRSSSAVRSKVQMSSMICEFSFIDDNEKSQTVSVYANDSDQQHASVLLTWPGGGVRPADNLTFRKLITEPVEVDQNNTGELIRYEDRNNDGDVDTKVQIVDTHEDIIWIDTNADGFFDEEYLWDNQNETARLREIIKIKVPCFVEQE